jgi:hypothetical protein
VIVKGRQPLPADAAAVTRAELREQLVELWAQLLECELRAEEDQQAASRLPAAPTPTDAVGSAQHRKVPRQ